MKIMLNSLFIKVFVMTSVFVFFFGKYNDSVDFELDYKDENKAINNSHNLKQVF